MDRQVRQAKMALLYRAARTAMGRDGITTAEDRRLRALRDWLALPTRQVREVLAAARRASTRDAAAYKPLTRGRLMGIARGEAKRRGLAETPYFRRLEELREVLGSAPGRDLPGFLTGLEDLTAAGEALCDALATAPTPAAAPARSAVVHALARVPRSVRRAAFAGMALFVFVQLARLLSADLSAGELPGAAFAAQRCESLTMQYRQALEDADLEAARRLNDRAEISALGMDLGPARRRALAAIYRDRVAVLRRLESGGAVGLRDAVLAAYQDLHEALPEGGVGEAARREVRGAWGEYRAGAGI